MLLPAGDDFLRLASAFLRRAFATSFNLGRPCLLSDKPRRQILPMMALLLAGAAKTSKFRLRYSRQARASSVPRYAIRSKSLAPLRLAHAHAIIADRCGDRPFQICEMLCQEYLICAAFARCTTSRTSWDIPCSNSLRITSAPRMIGILAERHDVVRFALRESVKECRVQQRLKLVVRNLRRRVPYASPYAGACSHLVCEIDQVLLSVSCWHGLPLPMPVTLYAQIGFFIVAVFLRTVFIRSALNVPKPKSCCLGIFNDPL
jgi:hypothetical protein